jgi:hypothetical protein
MTEPVILRWENENHKKQSMIYGFSLPDKLLLINDIYIFTSITAIDSQNILFVVKSY